MPRREMDTPGWAVTAAEKIQSFEDHLALSALIGLVAGSSYPGYRQIRWQEVNAVWDFATGAPAELPIAKADPNPHSLSSVIPRFKRSATIVETGKGLPETRNSLVKEYGPARASIAYTYRNKTHVGHLPGEITSLQTERLDVFRAAMRSGKNDFGAGIGVWLMEEQEFVLAPGSHIAADNVPIEALHYRYPNVNLF